MVFHSKLDPDLFLGNIYCIHFGTALLKTVLSFALLDPQTASHWVMGD
jgi:hypothetical protein